jgi:alpha-beta hydrolase superfamily lysophospholipase
MLTPGLFVLPGYSAFEKLEIGLAAVVAPFKRFRVPQDDSLFSRDPDVLAWIGQDRLGARAITARCLLQIERMLRDLRSRVSQLDLPLLVVEAAHDRLADNRRNRHLLTSALGERCTWRSFDAEHFLLAEPCKDQVIDALVEWTSTHSVA